MVCVACIDTNHVYFARFFEGVGLLLFALPAGAAGFAEGFWLPFGPPWADFGGFAALLLV